MEILAFLMSLGIVVLTATLWTLQVVGGKTYSKLGNKQGIRAQYLASARGTIKDRNGILLADSRPSFRLELYLHDMLRGGTKIPTKKNKNKRDVFDIGTVAESKIKLLSQELKVPLPAAHIKKIQRHLDLYPFQPYTLIDDVPPEVVARFYEKSPIISGADISVVATRSYPFGNLAAHLLGHIGKVEVQKTDPNNPYAYGPAYLGKQGVEKTMNEYLLGEDGERLVRVDTKGMIQEEVKSKSPIPGDTVYLTIDVRVQQIVESVMQPIKRGAAVVVDVNNGNILSMVSVPSYNPNSFVPAISKAEFKRLKEDTDTPMLNRTISSYPPGSIFKPVIALAGLGNGKLTGKSTFPCSTLTLGNHSFNCWIFNQSGGSHGGAVDMKAGIANSCNGYFFRAGIRTGGQATYDMGKVFGFGELTGVPLTSETAGVMPGPPWLKANFPKDRWTEGYVANTSIGEGFVMVTPLQMAMFASVIANGGVVHRPRLVDKVIDADDKLVYEDKREIKARLSLKPEDVEAVKAGMRAVVEEGTGKKAAHPTVKVSGKTGTSQSRGRSGKKTWFISFAPYDKPQYALVVMVENGDSGGSTCAPLAGQIWQGIFAIPPIAEGGQVEPLTKEFLEGGIGIGIPAMVTPSGSRPIGPGLEDEEDEFETEQPRNQQDNRGRDLNAPQNLEQEEDVPDFIKNARGLRGPSRRGNVGD